MKGVHELCPLQPRVFSTWSVNTVLLFLRSLHPAEALPLKTSTFKFVMLYALVSIARSSFLVAQTKRMTAELQLLSRFNAASLATNLTTTTMYNAILNGTILNLLRSLHDQVARVNNYYSKSAT